MVASHPQRGLSETATFPVQAVAHRLGVPTATLRSWTRRYGIGPVEHHPGRHRLYSESDIAVLERMRSLIEQGASPASAARAALNESAPALIDTDALLAAALRLDYASATHLLDQRLRHHGVIDTWETMCRPAFAAIEARQAEGWRCIDVEHMLSWAVTTSLHRLPFAVIDAPISVILACVDGETHALPLEALRAALCERGCGVLMLGAAVPDAAIADAVSRCNQAARVVLWSQTANTARPDVVRALLDTSPLLMVGGPGWDRVSLPAETVRLSSLNDAVQRLAIKR